MAGTVSDAAIKTRAKRETLKPRPTPYYVDLGRGLHLGYRKGQRGGVWVHRRYLGKKKYLVESIGPSNDATESDGLSFERAEAIARKLHISAIEEKELAAAGPPVTVEDVINEYVIVREAREGTAGKDAKYRLTKHVLGDPDTGVVGDPELSKKPLAALTADDLAKWRNNLAESMAPSSVIRTSSDLKAALNDAAVRYRSRLPTSLPLAIKDGLRSTGPVARAAREAQVLTDADVRAIIEATAFVDQDDEWESDLLRLVVVLAATGARFSQVRRQVVADVQTPQNRLMVPVSRKGRGIKATSRVAVRVGKDVLELLKPAVAGRRGPDPLLIRPRWKQVGIGKWEKTGRSKWLNASEMTRPWGLILAKAGLAADVVPYALRHSSIVRGLREGLPVRLVAALHDTSSAMIEKHYSAYIVDAMDELAARAVVPLVSERPTLLREVR